MSSVASAELDRLPLCSKQGEPEVWSTVSLGDLVHVSTDGVHPGLVPDLPYIGLEHIQPARTRLVSHGQAGDVRSFKTRFLPGDILYGKLRPYLDKAALADCAGICSTDILVLRPGTGVCGRYLAYLLHAHAFVQYAIATTTGVNHPRTSWSALRHFSFALPALPEQRAIADVLSSVERAIEATEAVIAATRELKRSLMRYLFTYGPVPLQEAERVPLKETEIGPVPEHWRLVAIADICQVRGGKRLPKGHAFAASPTAYPYIRVVDFADGTVDASGLKYLTEEDARKLEPYTIGPDDVYVSIAGTVGVVGTVPSGLTGAYLTENAAKLVITARERVVTCYLARYLASSAAQAQMQLRTTQTSQPKLALARLAQILVPLPPLGEQRAVAGALAALDAKTRAERAKHRALCALLTSLLDALMTGRLRAHPKIVA